MSKRRPTADDFVRYMKAKQQRSTMTPEEAVAKKDVAATDKKNDVTSLHALVEPADLTLVEGAKARAGRSVILT
jgi:hypothetical protein